MALILIIEDEEDLVDTLEYNLEQEGHQTRSAGEGERGLELAHREPIPDLILLDIMLPDISGKEVCRRLRAEDATHEVPVVMMTARGEEIDRVIGFEVGADDYVVKPFSVRELMLRIRAILRRVQTAPEDVEDDDEREIAFGRLKVDPPGHRVWVDSEEVRLTALEFRLLLTLLKRRGRVQSRDTLLSDVWGYSAEVTTRTVDTHIKRLRSKLGDCGSYIETIRGVGYRFASSPSDVS